MILSRHIIKKIRPCRLNGTTNSFLSSWVKEPIGTVGQFEFQLNFKSNSSSSSGNNNSSSSIISPWHDIPLMNGNYFNYVNEIPKFSKVKMEISTKKVNNPITQDVKNGKLREYHGPIYWNYGALPQTWEDPSVIHPEMRCNGDNDPIDVVEIGSKILEIGDVVRVKILGALPMIDDGELDWKLIAINAEDSLASKLNDVEDLQKMSPEIISGIREWFRWYKTPDGKPLNRYGLNERVLNSKEAVEVIMETNHYWKNLISGKTKSNLWIPPQRK
jgi:inorganic pyrophosphatase